MKKWKNEKMKKWKNEKMKKMKKNERIPCNEEFFNKVWQAGKTLAWTASAVELDACKIV